MEYHRASKLGAKDDSGGGNAWCGSFVAWVLAQHGHGAPTHAYRAKAWVGFGVVIKKPVYGAICYKNRAGGGHVAFIIGQARDGKHYFMLGGNQDNEVNITRYKAGLWESFVFPSGTHPGNTLPVYEGPSKNAGSEA